MSSGSATFKELLHGALADLRVAISSAQLDLLERHFRLVVDANRSMNLTRIIDPAAAAIKHYADSIALLAWAGAERSNIATVLDIGTGAGFPAVPLAVMRPGWRITAIDATAKKARFVADTAATLALENLQAIHCHSRHFKAAPFDLVVSRAVWALADCVEKAARLVRVGGWLVAYKTAALEAAEVEAAEAASARRHMKPRPPWPYELRLGKERLVRALYVVRREA